MGVEIKPAMVIEGDSVSEELEGIVEIVGLISGMDTDIEEMKNAISNMESDVNSEFYNINRKIDTLQEGIDLMNENLELIVKYLNTDSN